MNINRNIFTKSLTQDKKILVIFVKPLTYLKPNLKKNQINKSNIKKGLDVIV